MLFEDTCVGIIVHCISAVGSKRIDKRWTNMQISASSWLHCPIGVPSAICFTQLPSVMYSSFWSGNYPVDSILDRYVKSSILLLAFFKKVCQSLGTFAETSHVADSCVPVVSRVFFHGHRILTVPDGILSSCQTYFM